MKILINAYACSPGMGSEPGMAWNWVSNLAKFCELYIITEGEFREKIEAVVPMLEQGKNMHFYYNPVSEKIRKMCWNQGDWRFYKYYREWQWKTYLMAKEICSSEYILFEMLYLMSIISGFFSFIKLLISSSKSLSCDSSNIFTFILSPILL